MKSCGVIVEYNPFHNGHKYHIEKAREVSGAEIIIAVMSGDFLQRGEPAILDKWTRGKQALENGADLVIELPFAYAVQSADYFAKGGIKLLHELKVDGICFGTDSKASMDYAEFARFEKENSGAIEQEFKRIKNNGMSYPQQMTEVFRSLYPQWKIDFSSPNHILGMSYAKENIRYPKPMMLYPIQREQNDYHDETIRPAKYSSATSIRKSVMEEVYDKVEGTVPPRTYEDLSTKEKQTWENYWPLLKYYVTITSVTELGKIYQMVEGIEYRMKEMTSKADNFADFVALVKTKRFTWTRIQRLCVYILHNVKKQEIHEVWENSYLRVLGFNEKGRSFLGERKRDLTIPLITNVNQENEKILELDIRSGQVYQLGNQAIPVQDYYRSPIYLKN